MSAQRPSEVYPAIFKELPSMAGKTVAITGASRGLGYVTALALAKKGARLFLLNRPSPRSEEALAEIAAASTCEVPPQLIECDNLSFESVRRAAATLRDATADGLDVLCCNAGIMMQPDRASSDGYDITISTNVLSHFLLTREMMPSLKRAASLRGEARIVTMSSGSGFGGPAFNPSFYAAGSGGQCGGAQASYERYHQSKLANLLFTSSLHDKLQASSTCLGGQVKALACTPGVCATDMFVHVASRPGRPADLASVASVEDGACAQLKCICSPEMQSGDLWGPSGMGGAPVKIRWQPVVLVDEKSKARLWDLCEGATAGAFELT